MGRQLLLTLSILGFFTANSHATPEFPQAVQQSQILTDTCYPNEYPISPINMPRVLTFCLAHAEKLIVSGDPLQYLILHLNVGEPQIFQLSGFIPDQELSIQLGDSVLRSAIMSNDIKQAQMTYIYKVLPAYISGDGRPFSIEGLSPTGLRFRSIPGKAAIAP